MMEPVSSILKNDQSIVPHVDPQLEEYMASLSEQDKKIFQQMVEEELEKLQLNPNIAPCDRDSLSLNKTQQNSVPVDERQGNKQVFYQSQLKEAAAQPARRGDRVSLYSQKKSKEAQFDQTNSTSQLYDRDTQGSVLNIGYNNQSTYRRSDNNNNDDNLIKKNKQQAYSNQLSQDSKIQSSTLSVERFSRQSNRPPSNEYIESNYIASKPDLFANMSSPSCDKQNRRQNQEEYMMALKRDQAEKQRLAQLQDVPSKHLQSQSRSVGVTSASGMNGNVADTSYYMSNDYEGNIVSNARDKQMQYANQLSMDIKKKNDLVYREQNQNHTRREIPSQGYSYENGHDSSNNNFYPSSTNSNRVVDIQDGYKNNSNLKSDSLESSYYVPGLSDRNDFPYSDEYLQYYIRDAKDKQYSTSKHVQQGNQPFHNYQDGNDNNDTRNYYLKQSFLGTGSEMVSEDMQSDSASHRDHNYQSFQPPLHDSVDRIINQQSTRNITSDVNGTSSRNSAVSTQNGYNPGSSYQVPRSVGRGRSSGGGATSFTLG